MKKLFFINLLILTITSCSTKNNECINPKITDSKPKIIEDEPKYNCKTLCFFAKKTGCAEADDLIYNSECKSDHDCNFGECLNGKCTVTCEYLCNAQSDHDIDISIECFETFTKCEEEYPIYCRT